MVVKLLTLCAGRPLPPGRFLILLLEASRSQDSSAAGEIRSIENSSDLIENLTPDLPGYIVVPQPTTLRSDPLLTEFTKDKL
jgi:hypothetical protein